MEFKNVKIKIEFAGAELEVVKRTKGCTNCYLIDKDCEDVCKIFDCRKVKFDFLREIPDSINN